MSEQEQDKQKKIPTAMGQVVSDKMDQTIIVKVSRRERHPLYGKFVNKSSRFHVHDPENSCKTGDQVRIRSCRPLSKHKNWVLDKIL